MRALLLHPVEVQRQHGSTDRRRGVQLGSGQRPVVDPHVVDVATGEPADGRRVVPRHLEVTTDVDVRRRVVDRAGERQGPGLGAVDVEPHRDTVISATDPVPLAVEVGGHLRLYRAPRAAVDEELQRGLVLHLERPLVVALRDDRELPGPPARLHPRVERQGCSGDVELAVAVDLHEVVESGQRQRLAAMPVHELRRTGEQRGDAVAGRVGREERLRPDVLLGPVPDEAALRLRVGPDDVPELAEVAEAVAHRVRVLAEDQRFVRALRLLREPLRRRVARAPHVGERRVTVGVVGLVVDRAGRVGGLDPLRHVVVVRAEACLVARVPHEDARVVLVALDHGDHAVHERVAPLRLVRLAPPGAVLVVVGLDVDLVVDPDAVLVGEVVEVRVVRVVRGADGVDVELLHQRHVAFLRLAGHVPAVLGVGLRAVDALEQHALAVDQQRPVADLDLAEAGGVAGDVGRAVGRGERDHDGVEVRRLVGPLGRVAHRQRQTCRAAGGFRARRPDLLAPGVTQAGGDPVRSGGTAGFVAELDVRGERRVGVGGVEIGLEREVLDERRGRRVQRHRAEDARVPPLVVVLEIGTGAPPVHLHGDLVAAGLERGGDVELGRGVATLVVADVLAVDPHEVAGRHALEAQERLALGPVRGHVELADVRTGRVDVARYVGRVVRLHLGRDVAEDRVVQAVGLPGVRDGDGAPAGRVVVLGVEPGGHLGRLVRHGDPPLAVERPREVRLLVEERVVRLLPLSDHAWIFEVGVHVGRRIDGGGDRCHRTRRNHHDCRKNDRAPHAEPPCSDRSEHK